MRREDDGRWRGEELGGMIGPSREGEEVGGQRGG